MIWQGPTGTVAAARKMIGETNPLESLPGSIRGDYAVEVGRNIIHGSDSVDSPRENQLMVCGRERRRGLANDEQRLDSRIII